MKQLIGLLIQFYNVFIFREDQKSLLLAQWRLLQGDN